MQKIGLGTYRITDQKTMDTAVNTALQCGYRLFDTAAIYNNEQLLQKSLNDCRTSVQITSKIWIDAIEQQRIRQAAAEILNNLKRDSIDLLLLHWPVPGSQPAAWEELLRLQQDGVAQCIGVSNYTVSHLQQLLDAGLPLPAVNQFECTPFCSQEALRSFCYSHGITVQSYSPLARGRKLNHPLLLQTASTSGATPAQVMLAWALHRGISIIPKSIHPARIRENFAADNIKLTRGQLSALDRLDEQLHIARKPEDIPL